jgi:hypothetical protein
MHEAAPGPVGIGTKIELMECYCTLALETVHAADVAVHVAGGAVAIVGAAVPVACEALPVVGGKPYLYLG